MVSVGLGGGGGTMKFRTNFSFPFDAQLRWIAGLAWSTAALALLTAAFLVLGALHLKSGTPALADTWAQLSKTPPPTPSVSLPAGELESLRRDLKELNGLDAGEGSSTTSLLARLERLMPTGVRLSSFQQDLSQGNIHLVVESARMENLSKFLEALEKDGSFSSVNLTKQTQTQAVRGGANQTQFFLELTDGLS
jgi:hypothetical protein